MKIKTTPMAYEDVMRLPKAKHKPPRRPSIFFRTLVRLVARADLKAADVHVSVDPCVAKSREPALILMNHSCFLDLEIVSRALYPRPYCIVCTSDGFVGKEWLMRHLGCIPTQKFVGDVTLLRDMEYALHKKNCSVLMYPEASYSFDGCATPLPRRLGLLLKKLDVPVVMIRSYGAFAFDPLYNGLQKRKVSVRAEVTQLFDRAEIAARTVDELDARLDEAFTFDHFAWQQENRVRIDEPFRADGLDRILFQCASCGGIGTTHGAGTDLVCEKCGKRWTLDPYGHLTSDDGAPIFDHIPDWYRQERENVRREIDAGLYRLDTEVTIGVMVDYKSIYMVGDGHLTHDASGFTLDGCDGKLHYTQKPLASYGLYADYFWYEIGDVICIGNAEALYYCFPKKPGVVARTRLAAEELYKVAYAARRKEKSPIS